MALPVGLDMNPGPHRSPRTLGVTLMGLFLAPLVVACGSDDSGSEGGGRVELAVTVEDWTGWSREQPEPETFTKTLGEQDEFTVDVLGGPLTVTIVGIDDDQIWIETSDDVAPRTASGADHNDLEDTFTLDRDGKVAFSTPTLDAGTTVTIADE